MFDKKIVIAVLVTVLFMCLAHKCCCGMDNPVSQLHDKLHAGLKSLWGDSFRSNTTYGTYQDLPRPATLPTDIAAREGYAPSRSYTSYMGSSSF